jgi:hypothetical protein
VRTFSLGGKLPYTVYGAAYVDEIAMDQMEVDVGVGRGYRFYAGDVTFPFGFGLSMTSFSVALTLRPEDPVLPTEVAPSCSLAFRFQVTNVGRAVGDTVLQVDADPQSATAQHH